MCVLSDCTSRDNWWTFLTHWCHCLKAAHTSNQMILHHIWYLISHFPLNNLMEEPRISLRIASLQLVWPWFCFCSFICGILYIVCLKGFSLDPSNGASESQLSGPARLDLSWMDYGHYCTWWLWPQTLASDHGLWSWLHHLHQSSSSSSSRNLLSLIFVPTAGPPLLVDLSRIGGFMGPTFVGCLCFPTCTIGNHLSIHLYTYHQWSISKPFVIHQWSISDPSAIHL